MRQSQSIPRPFGFAGSAGQYAIDFAPCWVDPLATTALIWECTDVQLCSQVFPAAQVADEQEQRRSFYIKWLRNYCTSVRRMSSGHGSICHGKENPNWLRPAETPATSETSWSWDSWGSCLRWFVVPAPTKYQATQSNNLSLDSDIICQDLPCKAFMLHLLAF